MNEDEIKLYNAMKNATPEQMNKYTEDDWKEAERLSALAKKNPELLNPKVDEGTTVQGGIVFLNPTTSEKATKYAKENPEQDTYKVDALAGRSAGGPDQQEYNLGVQTKNLPQAFRDVAAYPASALTNLWARANEPEVDAAGKQTNKGEGYWAGYARNYPNTVAEAQKGNGVAGALADPVNLAMAIPGVAEVAGAGRFGEGIAKLATKYPRIARLIGGGLEGAGYTAASEGIDPTKELHGSDVAIGGGLGSALGLVAGLPRANQIGNEARAVATFPGTGYINTQSRKGATAIEHTTGYIPDADKLAILRTIKEKYAPGNEDDWGRYVRDLADENIDKYSKVDELAGNLGLKASEVKLDELRDLLKGSMQEGLGPYGNAMIERHINSRFGGFEDKLGADGSMPIHELGKVKGSFNRDLYGPAANNIQDLQLQRDLSSRANQAIEDLRSNRPAYVNPKISGTKELDDASVHEMNALMSKAKQLQKEGKYDELKAAYREILDRFPNVSYNDLADYLVPNIKSDYAREKALKLILNKTRVATASKREGIGIGKLWEGATHKYTPTGNAYQDPINLLINADAKWPGLISRLGLGATLQGSTNGMDGLRRSSEGR